MPKQILFNEVARKKLKSGIDKLTNVIKVTLGPKARHVVLDKGFGTPEISDDGVSIAKEIELENKKFLKRLVRIDSGLSRDKMERDFENHVKNEKIMRKIKDYERGYSPKKIKHILNHLPNLFTSPPSQ